MGAPAARAAELSKLWAKDGHEVSVLTGFPNHPTGVVVPAYRRKMRRLVMRETVDGVDVTRAWLLPLPNRKSWERALNYASFFVSSAISGLFLPKPDIVIGTSPQLLVALASWWVAKFHGVPFVFEVRDLWPESLEAVGMGRPGSLLHRSLSRIANFLYRKSDHIVVVTSAFKSYLSQHRQIPPEKMSVVENGVDMRLFRPRAADAILRREMGAEGKFLVSYIGTMGMAQGLETVLDAASLLQHTHPDIVFLLLGEGAEREKLISLASLRNLRNVRFIAQQSRERIPSFICASDACLVTLKKTELFKTVLPTKLLEYMACARPVILGVDGEARRIVDQAGAGIFVEPQDAGQLADAVVRLAGDPELCQSLGRNGNAHIAKWFSREQTASKYLQVLGGLVSYPEEEIQAA